MPKKLPAQRQIMASLIDGANKDELTEQVYALRGTNQILTNELKKLHKKLGHRAEFLQQVKDSFVAEEPFSPFKYLAGKTKTSHPIVPVLYLADWHIGEKVERDEVEGFNEYNWDIAQAGIFGIVDDFLKWVEIQRSFYPITQCAVVVNGDLVSGDIHQELLSTNEWPLPVQTAKAGHLLGEVFRILSGHFDVVTAYEQSADNHGRLQKKPQAKQKAENNVSYLVHQIANLTASKCANFHSVESVAMKMVAKINSKRFLIEHGDMLKGVMGIPFYAFAREVGREAVKRMNTDKGFDYLMLAHFHTPYFMENRLIGTGSLSGTSEFDHGCGRHALPSQVAFLVHPKHGVFNFTAFIRKDCIAK